MARLRLSHIVIQPVLVYDDGEEFTPGPELNAAHLLLPQAVDMLATLPAEVEKLAEQILSQDDGEPTPAKEEVTSGGGEND
jgi:hypothetical protein